MKDKNVRLTGLYSGWTTVEEVPGGDVEEGEGRQLHPRHQHQGRDELWFMQYVVLAID